MRNRFLWQNLPSYDVEGAGSGSVPQTTSASSTPAPAPSPSSNTTQSAGTSPAQSPEPKPNAFDQMGEPDNDGEDTIIIAEETLDPVADPAAALTSGSPAPAPQAKPPVDPKAATPAVPAAAPKEPVAAQPQPAPSSAPAEPQSLVQQLDQHRDAVIAGLAAKEFALTKEEAEGLELDPAKTVTQLMAKTYYRATQSALLHIQNFVPQMVVSMVKALNDQQKAEDAFYGKYPHLDRAKHSGDVNQFNGVFRSSNPAMQMDELLSMVAAAVTAKHGLTPGAPQAANGQQPVPPQPRVPAFVPARPGAAVRVTPEPESPFGGLGQDFDD